MAQQIIKNEKGKSYLLDHSLNRITLLDGRFYYGDSGEPIPSVTTILEAYPKGAQYYKWLKDEGSNADDLMIEAGRKGSVVHDLTERYDKGEKIELINETGKMALSTYEWAMFERYVDFTKRFNPKHELIEQNVVSEKLGYAGTIDRPKTIINGRSYLVDIKTGPTIYDYYWCQLAAYRELAKTEMKMKVDDVAVLHLNAKIRTENPKEIQGIGWKLYTPPNTHEYYLDLFHATKKLWTALNGNTVPKQIVHQLSHCKVETVEVSVKTKSSPAKKVTK